MAPASSLRSRPLKKADFALFIKPLKPTLYADTPPPPPRHGVTYVPPNIKSISWSATGNLLATCTGANIRVWNAERGPNIKNSTELKNAHPKGGVAFGSVGVHGELVEKVAFCPNLEGVLASCGLDGVVRLWDVRAPGAVTAVGGKGTVLGGCKVGGEAAFLTWRPNGAEILVGRKDDEVYSVDVRRITGMDGTAEYDLEPTKRLSRGKDIPYEMAFSNTGREVFATTYDGTVKILDYPSMAHLHTLSAHPAPCYAVQHSPAGNYLAIGSGDGTISLWDTYSWLSTHSLTAPNQTTSIRHLGFSWDGMYLVAGAGSDAKEGMAGLNVYHVDTGEVVHMVETTYCPCQVAWHPTRYWIAYAGDHGGLKVMGGLGTGL
ncbi:hypothetical protein B0A55_10421 [Friedmanniomyces simplex]|uniref:Uncharacterized protein n=1 Tax=Friedmanniomyces simplex TaxID=329884 RepID=A0A4U0X5D4_9PEZI|nr:hypothetical protein B0A55_10421 [Friedmanniomyces simplex]